MLARGGRGAGPPRTQHAHFAIAIGLGAVPASACALGRWGTRVHSPRTLWSLTPVPLLSRKAVLVWADGRVRGSVGGARGHGGKGKDRAGSTAMHYHRHVIMCAHAFFNASGLPMALLAPIVHGIVAWPAHATCLPGRADVPTPTARQRQRPRTCAAVQRPGGGRALAPPLAFGGVGNGIAAAEPVLRVRACCAAAARPLLG